MISCSNPALKLKGAFNGCIIRVNWLSGWSGSWAYFLHKFHANNFLSPANFILQLSMGSSLHTWRRSHFLPYTLPAGLNDNLTEVTTLYQLSCLKIMIVWGKVCWVVTHQPDRWWWWARLTRSISWCAEAVPNGFPNPTRYPVFSSIPDPIQFWKSSASG